MSKTKDEFAVWQDRWQGMHESMSYWLAMADKGQERFARQETLSTLLASLQAFGQSQMEFFLGGLQEKPQYRLEPSADYPWEYVFRTTVDQIGYDMDVLSRAAHQRMPSLMPPELLKTLDLADRLAYRALKPALDHNLIDHDTTVVTYFQKAVNVRLTPYAPVVLVGIPFSAVKSPRDLLALPHEVGHYVFRDGRVRDGRFADSRFSSVLYSRFAHQPVWFNAWLEEIFADMYGCLVGGPVTALSFIELVTDDPLDEFTAQDGEHPAAAVRPEIYFSTLQRMGGYDTALEKLAANWQALFVERGNPQVLTLPNGDEPVTIGEIKADLNDKVVDLLLQEQFLGALLPNQDSQAHPLWSRELDNEQPVEQLYAGVKEFVATVTPQNTPIPELQRSANAKMCLVKGEPEAHNAAANGADQSLGATGLWIDAIKAAANQNAQQGDLSLAVPWEIWTVLLDAGGWATEGPGGAIAH